MPSNKLLYAHKVNHSNPYTVISSVIVHYIKLLAQNMIMATL